MRTVESSTALSMIGAIFFNYLCNFFLLFLGTLLGIGDEVCNTAHGVLDLRLSVLTVDHDLWFEDNHIVLNGGFQEITNP